MCTKEEAPLKSVRNLLEKNYYIPNYQRGYRWGKEEVTKLLDDIWDFDSNDNSKFYCLQPLIILPQTPPNTEEVQRYEVVDGQQRLTTLNLIVHYFNEYFRGSSKYPEMDLCYQTRPESSKFISTLNTEETEGVQEKTEKTLNIDFWHIRHAYDYIHEWFTKKKGDKSFDDNSFQAVFLDKVKVIWYEIEKNEDPINVFERNNIGKIPLTNVELIKALILKDGCQADSNHLRQQLEIAREWDEIEQGLRDPNLWAFIFGNKAMPSVCIEQLFAIELGLEQENQPKIFEVVESEMQKSTDYLQILWQRIQELYLMIIDWYNKHETYHYIGYLIQTNTSVQELRDLAKGSTTKKEFITKLRNKIAQGRIRKIHYNEHDGFYKNKNGYKTKVLYNEPELRPLLLLYNIELCLREGNTERFPFECLQTDGKKRIKWDVEHIDSQTPKEITSRKDQKLWLETTRNALEDQIDNNLKQKINAFLDQIEDNQFYFEHLRRQLQKLAQEEHDIYSHSIGNLALLDSSTNRSYGNDLFVVKRAKLQEREQSGQFIPQGTKIAFMKYFPKCDLVLNKWNTADKRAHEEHIYELVKDYINGE